jgi:hypothetical protein
MLCWLVDVNVGLEPTTIVQNSYLYVILISIYTIIKPLSLLQKHSSDLLQLICGHPLSPSPLSVPAEQKKR